jgi:hypothetical protein
MSVKQSKFQVTGGKQWAGMTTKFHIAKVFGAQPQLLSNVTHKMLSASGVKNLDTTLSALPIKYVDTDDDFTWKLVGASERNIQLVEARADGSVVTSGSAGVSGAEFELVFGEKYFSDVNVLVGEKNELYQFRVMDEPEQEGTNYVYRVTLLGAGVAGVPYTEVAAGKRFSKDFSPVEDTLSIKGGDISFSTPIEMRNEFTTLRMEHKVPGNMLGRRVGTQVVGLDAQGNTKELNVWMQHVEWKFDIDWSKEKARACMFARSNRDSNGQYNDYGKSGHVLRTGAGIREQMEVSNTTVYNASQFSITLLESILYDISEARLDMNDRTFLVRTGERGIVQAHKAIMAEASGWQSLTDSNPATYQRTSSPFHTNAFKAGFQFTEWLAPNGLHIIFEVDPMYDDKVRNKILHPLGGVAESYRYDILYVGNSEEPNIQKVMLNGTPEIHGYAGGFRNPFTGEVNNMHMSTMEDSATYTRYTQLGVVVFDPSKTVSLIPSLLV